MKKASGRTTEVAGVAESVLQSLKAVPGFGTAEFLDEGATGILCKYQTDGGYRVAKALRPELNNDASARRAFVEESTLLRAFTHPHIIGALDLVEVPYLPSGLPVPVLVMEYFPHRDLWKQRNLLAGKPLSYLISIIDQLLDALAALHAHRPHVCHLDIKERNILFDPAGPLVKLTDFGSAKVFVQDTRDTTVKSTFTYWPLEWQQRLRSSDHVIRGVPIVLPRDQVKPDVDLHMLSVTLNNLLSLMGKGESAAPLFAALGLFLERLNWDDRTQTLREEVFKDAGQARKAFHSICVPRTLPPMLAAEGTLRIPVVTVTHFNDRIRTLVNNPWFRRLKRVNQLATAHLVYPGAKHDRFEHSLGVYEHAARYLEALLRNSAWAGLFVDERDCAAVAATALLHDIGHYPFAHQIEDLKDSWSHEALAYLLIAGPEGQPPPAQRVYKELTSRQTRRMLGEPDDLRRAIRTAIGADDDSAFRYFVRFFGFCYRKELQGAGIALHLDRDYHRRWDVLKGIVSGTIDADKLDYIRRDSWHCGVRIGREIDTERFLMALTHSHDRRADGGLGDVSLGITEKGRMVFEQIVNARYEMFSEVYWHHTVRVFTAMVRRLLSRARSQQMLTLESLFTSSDDAILEDLARHCLENTGKEEEGLREICHGLLERRPFVRLWTVRHEESEYAEITARRNEFYDSGLGARALKPYFEDLTAGDLLWDVPKPGKEILADVSIVTEGEVPIGAGPRLRELAHQFETWVRKVRLFVAPRFRPQLREMSRQQRSEMIMRLRQEIRGVLIG